MLRDPLYLDAINSLLICGEYPHLFTNDELDGLLQVLTAAVLSSLISLYPMILRSVEAVTQFQIRYCGYA